MPFADLESTAKSSMNGFVELPIGRHSSRAIRSRIRLTGEILNKHGRTVDTTDNVVSNSTFVPVLCRMRTLSRLPANALVWLLAAALLVQPVAALDCRCTCRELSTTCGDFGCDHQPSTAANDDAADHHGKHGHCANLEKCSDSSCQEIGFDSEVDGHRAFRPCRCPRECDCRSRHDSQIGSVADVSVRVERDGAAARYDVPTLYGAGPELSGRSVQRGVVRRSIIDPTALESCARYCRFTI